MSSRWVYAALGEADYGLFNLVGTLIVFSTVLNGLIASSAARALAHSIGRDDANSLSDWFCAAVGVHLILATILVALGWTLGDYSLTRVLNVPSDRHADASLLLGLCLASAFFSMLGAPFLAMFTAKQRQVELAVWGIVQSVLVAALAWKLSEFNETALLIYAVGMTAIGVGVQVAQMFRAAFIFPECAIRLKRLVQLEKWKAILSFASWNLFGVSGVLLRDQGSAVMINLNFGLRANAAYAIGLQVASQVTQLSLALVNAFGPAMATAEGASLRSKMIAQAETANRLAAFTTVLVGVPLIGEMQAILQLWLHRPPEFSAELATLLLIAVILDRLSTGHMLAVSAQGQIAAYQFSLGVVLMATLPLSYLFVRLGHPISSVGVAFVSTAAVATAGRVVWGRLLLQMSMRSWSNQVLWPSAALAATIYGSAKAFRYVSGLDGVLGLVGSLAVSSSAGILFAWWFGLERREREFLCQFLRNNRRSIPS